jgi:hypothetical protein
LRLRGCVLLEATPTADKPWLPKDTDPKPKAQSYLHHDETTGATLLLPKNHAENYPATKHLTALWLSNSKSRLNSAPPASHPTRPQPAPAQEGRSCQIHPDRLPPEHSPASAQHSANMTAVESKAFVRPCRPSRTGDFNQTRDAHTCTESSVRSAAGTGSVV